MKAIVKQDTGILGLSLKANSAGDMIDVEPFVVMPGAEPSSDYFVEQPHGPVWPRELLEFQ